MEITDNKHTSLKMTNTSIPGKVQHKSPPCAVISVQGWETSSANRRHHVHQHVQYRSLSVPTVSGQQYMLRNAATSNVSLSVPTASGQQYMLRNAATSNVSLRRNYFHSSQLWHGHPATQNSLHPHQRIPNIVTNSVFNQQQKRTSNIPNVVTTHTNTPLPNNMVTPSSTTVFQPTHRPVSQRSTRKTQQSKRTVTQRLPVEPSTADDRSSSLQPKKVQPFVDPEFRTGSWEELEQRSVRNAYLYSTALLYAYKNNRILRLSIVKNSTNKEYRVYQCHSCPHWQMKFYCFNYYNVHDNHQRLWQLDPHHLRTASGLSVLATQCECSDKAPVYGFSRHTLMNISEFKHFVEIHQGPTQLGFKYIKNLIQSLKTTHPAILLTSNCQLNKSKVGVKLHFQKKLDTDYKQLPAFLDAVLSKNPNLSMVLQVESRFKQFYRYFCAFPASDLVGDTTFAIHSIDGCHSRCDNYDGVIINITTKTLSGNCLLVAFGLIPQEDVSRLAWFLQCCQKHGLKFVFPLLTDQGKLLAAVRSIHESLQFKFVLFLCLQHIIRCIKATFPLLFGSTPTGKALLSSLRKHVHDAAYCTTTTIFFAIIGRMMEEFIHLNPHKADDIVGVVLYLFSLDPRVWTVFANTNLYDVEDYNSFVADAATMCYSVKEFHLGLQKNFGNDVIDVDLESLQKYVSHCQQMGKVNYENDFKFKKFTITDAPRSMFGFSKTNISENFAGVNKLNGNCSTPPSSVIKNILLQHNDQLQNLHDELQKNKNELYSTTGMRISDVFKNTSTYDDILADKVDLDLKFIPKDNRWSLTATFPNAHYPGTVYTVTIKWDKDENIRNNNYHVVHTCDHHIMSSSQFLYPCTCVEWLSRWITLDKVSKLHSEPEWPFVGQGERQRDVRFDNFYPNVCGGRRHAPKLDGFKERYIVHLPSIHEVENAQHNCHRIVATNQFKDENLQQIDPFDLSPPDKYKETMNRGPRIPSSGEGIPGRKSRSKKRRKCEGDKVANKYTECTGPMTMSNSLQLPTTDSPELGPSPNIERSVTKRLCKHLKQHRGPRKCSVCQGEGHNSSTCPWVFNPSGRVRPPKELTPGPYAVFDHTLYLKFVTAIPTTMLLLPLLNYNQFPISRTRKVSIV